MLYYCDGYIFIPCVIKGCSLLAKGVFPRFLKVGSRGVERCFPVVCKAVKAYLSLAEGEGGVVS